MRKSNLYIFTFLSIFFSFLGVALLLFPVFQKQVRNTYMQLNLEASAEQTHLIGTFINRLQAQGIKQEKIIKTLQEAITDTANNRTYVCLFDDKSMTFLAHPNAGFIGRTLPNLKYSDSMSSSAPAMTWKNAVKEEKIKPIGFLKNKRGFLEMVASFSLPRTSMRLFSHENISRLNSEISSLNKAAIYGFIFIGFLVAFPASIAALKLSRKYEREIEMQRMKSEKLLLNILPQSIAERLKNDESNIADYHDDVSVLFIDIVGFTSLTNKTDPRHLISTLSRLFSAFDGIARDYHLEKIKTIGDAYFVAGGVPTSDTKHLEHCIDAGLECIRWIHQQPELKNTLDIRIGIHSGPVVAGVIGVDKFCYDLWGDTVNIAARLESTSLPGKLHCSKEVYKRMKDKYIFKRVGFTELKGLGERETYFISEKKN